MRRLEFGIISWFGFIWIFWFAGVPLSSGQGLDSLITSSKSTAPAAKAEFAKSETLQDVIVSPTKQDEVVRLFTNGGKTIDLNWQATWTMDADQPPILGLSAVKSKLPDDCVNGKKNPYAPDCQNQYLLIRKLEEAKPLTPVMQVTDDGLLISTDLQQTLKDHSDWVIAVNGKRIGVDQVFPFTVPSDADAWTIEWFRKKRGCRFYSPLSEDRAAINLWPANFGALPRIRLHPNSKDEITIEPKNNGITVGKAKLFDDAALR